MSSASAGADIHDRFIRDVFIDPIRTVVVVDDEYPTLDSLAAKEAGDKDAWNKGNTGEVKAVRQLLKFARNRSKPWLVDVHDGKKITSTSEQGIATHLDHSDLLVLDYHLDGNDGSGDAAINILRKLAQSDHFNLVIVHTKGYQGDLEKVNREIALGLTHTDPALSINDEIEKSSLIDALDEWEEGHEGITAKLEAEISENTYLQVRSDFPGNPCGILSLEDGARLRELWLGRPEGLNIDLGKLAKWIVSKKQEQLIRQFSPDDLGSVHIGSSDGVNWIRTDKLFITVLPKECAPDQFEISLINAIRTSFPSPHRLLLTRMRAEIDQRGLNAETAILKNRHLQAEWLNDFLKSDPVDNRAVIQSTINRHWEALGDELSARLASFAEELRDYFSPMGSDEVMRKCGLNMADVGTNESLKRFNCFSSTKPVDRSHLTTGHVFRNVDSGEEGGPGFWVCLSPACDMVPDQKRTGIGLGDSIPFVAVRLQKVADRTALKNATNNAFLFLDVDGDICTFSIYREGNVTSNPDWEQKFARDKGRFSSSNGFTLGTLREIEGELKVVWGDASVVAQLRSEYALNLLQRIGMSLSRPGLGMNFKARP